MAAKLQCEICGGKLVGKPGGIFECENCGTEYSTAWAKEKIQEITGKVQIEGTVEVTGKVQVEGGTVQVDTSANKEALLKRAFMMLEEGEKEKADSFLEQVLNMDPECAEAYLGKLMLMMKVRTRDTLKDSRWFIDQDKNYKKACEYGSPELKTWLVETGKTVRTRIEEENRRYKEKHTAESYEKATQLAAENTVSAQLEAANVFKSISAYKDSEQRRTECLAKAEALKAEQRAFTIKANQLTKHRIAVGYKHVVALKSDGTVLTTGNTVHWMSAWSDITAVTAGWNHTVGLRTDGTVIAVGSNAEGQCNVSEWKDISSIAAAYNQTIGLKRDGTVIATGDNLDRQCEVSTWRDIIAIAAGDHHTLGLQKDGTVVATGNNRLGQCNVCGWDNIVAIEAGGSISFGFKKDGTAVNTSNLPLRSSDSEIIVSTAIGASSLSSVYLRSDGAVMSWSGSRIWSGTDIIAVAVSPDIYGPTFGITKEGMVVSRSDKYDVSGWKIFDSIEELETQERQKAEADRLRQEEAERHRIEAEEAERRRREEAERRRIEAEEAERRLQERKRQETIETAKRRIASWEEDKQAAEDELANLKGLFSGKRRRELEAQIAQADEQLAALQAELKSLE